MGTMIHLAVGRLEIDWGKNSGFTDHSPLFQPTDLALVPYYYVDPSKETYVDEIGEERYKLYAEYKEGMSKTLGEVDDRISLLGYTLGYCEREFAYISHLNNFESARFPFEQLKRALEVVDVNAMSADYGEMGEDFGKFFRRQLFGRLRLDEFVHEPNYLKFEIAQGMENLSAYTILRLLARNPHARTLPVTWQFNDLEQAGWASRKTLTRPLDQKHRFLIVTEGSSDAKIIKHAFALLRPHVADFFDFVDMQDGYPFTGTGNLHKFLQGLISISVMNNIIVIYDNDAEGVASYNRSFALNVPDNMRVLRLPDRLEFQVFNTVGPNGEHFADINGKAAAIECYLDLQGEARVRWNNFNPHIGQYQGELEGKTDYARHFLSQRSRRVEYSYTGIEAVLDMIIEHCVDIRESIADIELQDG